MSFHKKIAKKFYTSGNKVSLVTYEADALTDTLAPAVYILEYSQFTGFYFERVEDKFDLPKLYGKVQKRADKIINTFIDRKSSTGVLLSGDKGTGKSMLSMLVSNMLIDAGHPVILIKAPYSGSDFENILNAVPNAVLIFDEFAKTYKVSKDGDKNPQEQLLSFFDGQGAKKRLMIFTENSTVNINEFMLSRPGRIFYHFKYSKLESDVITEYCTEHALKDTAINDIQNYAVGIHGFSFDMLKAIVEEVIRYPEEDTAELIADINIKEPHDRVTEYVIDSIKDLHGNTYKTLDEDGVVYSCNGHYSEFIAFLPTDETLKEEMIKRAQQEATRILKDEGEEIPAEFTLEDIYDYLPKLKLHTRMPVLSKKGKVTFSKTDVSSNHNVFKESLVVVATQDAPVKYANYQALMAY